MPPQVCPTARLHGPGILVCLATSACVARLQALDAGATTLFGPAPQQSRRHSSCTMGRLRNLSESWKSFRDPHASLSAPSRSSSNNHTTAVDRDSPADLQISPADHPPGPYPRPDRADRTASRPTSMVYTPPSMDTGRDNQIEELVPVFRYRPYMHLVYRSWEPISADTVIVSSQATAISSTKKVITAPRMACVLMGWHC